MSHKHHEGAEMEKTLTISQQEPELALTTPQQELALTTDGVPEKEICVPGAASSPEKQPPRMDAARRWLDLALRAAEVLATRTLDTLEHPRSGAPVTTEPEREMSDRKGGDLTAARSWRTADCRSRQDGSSDSGGGARRRRGGCSHDRRGRGRRGLEGGCRGRGRR